MKRINLTATKIIYIGIVSLLSCITAIGQQGVGINASGNQPHASAILDLSSTAKGFLVPRMTAAQRIAIVSPATGLQVYQTDGSTGFYYFDGNAWVALIAGGGGGAYTAGTGIDITGTMIAAKNTTALWNANQLQGKDISSTAPLNGDVLQYDIASAQWRPATISSVSSGWLLTGNAGLNATHFIGTTDAQPFIGKVNNVQVFRFGPASTTTIIGYQAGKTDPTGGSENHFVGYQSGFNNTSGFDNHFEGLQAGFSNTTGYSNQFIGLKAGYSNTTSTNNLFVGPLAGYNNTTGNNNQFIGDGAGLANTTGSNNYFNGFQAGQANTANNNHFEGYKSGYNNTTGTNNFFEGYQSGYSNSTGSANYFSGNNAGYSNTTGIANQFTGNSAGYNNNTGSNNSFTGNHAGFLNTSGKENVATGSQSLNNNTSGNSNVAIGRAALFSNTTGNSNVALGSGALFSNTNASNTVAIGDSALFNNGLHPEISTAEYNTAVGSKSLLNNQYGSANTAVGYKALLYNEGGDDNIGIGAFSLLFNYGNENTVMGNLAMGYSNAGDGNTVVGYGGLLIADGIYNCTALGKNVFMPDGAHNSTAIGVDAVGIGSNTVVVGNTSTIKIGGYTGWTTLSDGRFKKNLQENVSGLDFITKLRPVTYTLDIEKINKFLGEDERNEKAKQFRANNGIKTDTKKELAEQKDKAEAIAGAEKVVYSGFIAQEVEAVANTIGYNFSGVKKPQSDKDHYGLSYGDFVVPLVKAIQEQQVMIDELKKEIELLKKNK